MLFGFFQVLDRSRIDLRKTTDRSDFRIKSTVCNAIGSFFPRPMSGSLAAALDTSLSENFSRTQATVCFMNNHICK